MKTNYSKTQIESEKEIGKRHMGKTLREERKEWEEGSELTGRMVSLDTWGWTRPVDE